ncbi:ABC transporter permease subunit [Bacillus carboniphilus]|uniref:ABC transporter permease subunit n=1 Tax=Bacillus carboniphilus TaxID=86663 RepID=A0ABY9JUL3_9BACI|nr:ABC transporter permease subunit [Bacillus carboniphilus]WLR41371.1 ABC transporter permease subunit [Bacillus carboniphilus]
MAKDNSVSTPFWRDKRVIPILLQLLFAFVVIIVVGFLINNALNGLERLGIKFGFSFLENTASFTIKEALISFHPTDSYSRALLVGILNTLKVSFFGIIFATIIGVFVGIFRLSSNWLVSKIASVYTEIFRNTPLLVQMVIWYYAVFLPLPVIENGVKSGPFIFSNRGIAIPWLNGKEGSFFWLIAFIVAIIVGFIVWKWRLDKQIKTGKKMYPALSSLGVFLVILILSSLFTGGVPYQLSLPTINAKQFVGGYVVSPEFSAVLIALVIYTSTYIAEVVRGGILGVPKGQVEAARALGLKGPTIMRTIVLPQAVRIIIPPVTSQYLNLIKNSSLAVVVAYPDVVNVGNTVMNNSGHYIEIVIIFMVVYLIINLITSVIMNIFNKKFQIVER